TGAVHAWSGHCYSWSEFDPFTIFYIFIVWAYLYCLQQRHKRLAASKSCGSPAKSIQAHFARRHSAIHNMAKMHRDKNSDKYPAHQPATPPPGRDNTG